MSVLPSNSTDDDDQLDGDDNDNEEDVDGKKKSNAYAAAVPEINILGLGAKVMDLLTVSKFVGQIFCIAIGGGDEEADRNELFFYEHGMADGFGFWLGLKLCGVEPLFWTFGIWICGCSELR